MVIWLTRINRSELNSTRQCIRLIPRVYRDTKSGEKYWITKSKWNSTSQGNSAFLVGLGIPRVVKILKCTLLNIYWNLLSSLIGELDATLFEWTNIKRSCVRVYVTTYHVKSYVSSHTRILQKFHSSPNPRGMN